MHGALRKYVDHPADFCFKLPDCLTFEQGALVEPLSIAGQTNCLHWRHVFLLAVYIVAYMYMLLYICLSSGCSHKACMFLQHTINCILVITEGFKAAAACDAGKVNLDMSQMLSTNTHSAKHVIEFSHKFCFVQYMHAEGQA